MTTDHKSYPALIGAIAGDTIGSIYEFNNTKRTDFELLQPGMNYTDDSLMTLAVADWLLKRNLSDDDAQLLIDIMRRCARQYPCPMGGYGGRFFKWLISPSPKPYNSWGNGSAMRVSGVGYAADTLEEALRLAEISAAVTHNHPEGIKGAQATAAAVFMARTGSSKEEIRNYIEQTFQYNLHRTCDSIRPTYHFDESCQGTVPEAIVAFLDSHDFESAMRLAVSLGGDSDTLACITGGIAAAYYNNIPQTRRTSSILLPTTCQPICSKQSTDSAYSTAMQLCRSPHAATATASPPNTSAASSPTKCSSSAATWQAPTAAAQHVRPSTTSVLSGDKA